MRQTLLALLSLVAACTEPAPWSREGTEGRACFPDETCDPGLDCVGGTCVRAGSPGDGGADLPDGLRREDAKGDRSADRPGACAAPPAAPALLPHPAITAQATVPIRGQAPGAKEVVISGGKVMRTGAVVLGLFCVEVELYPNALTKLEVVARDAKGCESAPTTTQVAHTAPAPQNLLSGKVASVNIYQQSGALSLLTDGQSSASVKFAFYDAEVTTTCDTFQAIRFNLSSTQQVDEVVVKYPQKAGFKGYAACWDLWVSTKTSPEMPTNDGDSWKSDWTLAKQSSTQGAGDLKIPLSSTQARYLALLLYEDDNTGMWESFEIAEIEAWGPSAVPPPDTCP